MLNQSQLQELDQIRSNYSKIHDELTDLNNRLVEIELNKSRVIEDLNSLREKEKETINKIEKQIGRKIDYSELLKMLTI
jgi:septation ring formation regulator EzrA